MSRTLLHNWESSIERNKNNTEELLKIAEDIYNTAYARGKASEERPKGEWLPLSDVSPSGFGTWVCSQCGHGFRGIKSKMPYCRTSSNLQEIKE